MIYYEMLVGYTLSIAMKHRQLCSVLVPISVHLDFFWRGGDMTSAEDGLWGGVYFPQPTRVSGGES